MLLKALLNPLRMPLLWRLPQQPMVCLALPVALPLVLALDLPQHLPLAPALMVPLLVCLPPALPLALCLPSRPAQAQPPQPHHWPRLSQSAEPEAACQSQPGGAGPEARAD